MYHMISPTAHCHCQLSYKNCQLHSEHRCVPGWRLIECACWCTLCPLWPLAPRRPELLFRAPCTRRCHLPLRPTTSRPRHDMATTPPGVCIRIPRRMRPQDPAASRLRRNTEDPALPPPPRPPHAAVNICPIAHTWPLPLGTRSTGSPCASPPTARTTANAPSQFLVCGRALTCWASEIARRGRAGNIPWVCVTVCVTVCVPLCVCVLVCSSIDRVCCSAMSVPRVQQHHTTP